MKIGPFTINLADRRPTTESEIGTAATGGAPSLFEGEIIPTDKIKIEDLIKMRQRDGTVSALYNVLTYPILANPWSIEPEDDTPEAKKQAQFVEEALKRPPHKGGMTTPFDLVLADMLRAVLEKHRAFEKVYTLTAEGKITYKKIASRDNSTIRIMTDDRGGFNGIKQEAYIGKKFETVVIPREKAFLYTFGKEKNWLEGESAFRAAYYHYEKKHRLYYLAHQAVQVGALPPRVVKGAPKAKQPELDATVAAVDRLGVNTTVGIPDGYALEPYEAGKGRIDPVPIIDHHNAEMARSILAQFIMLGTGGNASTGSWALSNDQSDMFILALRGLMSSIESHITSYLLPDLIEYNFASPKYPSFKFANITDATTQLLKEVALKVLDKRPEGIPDDMVRGVVDKLATQLDIDLDKLKEVDPNSGDGTGTAEEAMAVIDQTQEIAKQALNGAQITSLLKIVEQVVTGQLPFDTARATIVASFPALDEVTIDKILDPAKNFKPSPQLSRRGLHFLADKRWKRPLTPAEKKVNLQGIEKKLNDLEKEFLDATKPIWDEIRKQVLADLTKILDAKDYKKLDDFEIKFGPDYKKVIMDQMIDAYGYAKNGAADELNVGTPPTPAETRARIKQQAETVVEKQFSDLKFLIKEAIDSARRKNQLSNKTELATGDVLKTVGALISSFYSDKVGLTGAISIASAINSGRDDVFQKNTKIITKYQYSAILDETTCPICEDLDGNVVDEAEYRSTDWLPPIHANCRCIWVAISEEEEDQPEITGLPDEPGGTTQPQLSADSLVIEKVKRLEDQVVILTDALANKIADEALPDEQT